MEILKISDRLMKVASLVHKGARVADIGTDHGYLPIYLVQNGISEKVYACDVRKKPLERAHDHISSYGLNDNITICLADGLKGIESGMVDTVTICGMGGKLMQDIIETGKDRLNTGTQLILSPQSEVRDFREYLLSNNIGISEEYVIKEDGKYYFIMNCVYNRESVHNNEHTYKEEELRYGKYLIDNKSEVLREYLQKEYSNFANIYGVLKTQNDKKPSASVEDRLKELEKDIKYNRLAYDAISLN